MAAHIDSHLTVAAGTCDFELLSRVIDEDFDLDAQDSVEGITVLHIACCALALDIQRLSCSRNKSKRDSVSFLKKLCVHLAHLLDRQDFNGQTPLHYAVAAEQAELVSVLVQHGANVNVQDHALATPLLLAVRMRLHACIKILVDGRADANVPDKRGLTPLMWACHLGDAQAVALLLNHPCVSLDAQNPKGLTALHMAVARQATDCVHALLSLGASRTIVDAKDRRPLDMTANQKLRGLFTSVAATRRAAVGWDVNEDTSCLNRPIRIQDFPNIIPTVGQLFLRDSVKSLHSKYHQVPAKKPSRRSPNAPLIDSNLDDNLTTKQLKTLISHYGISARKGTIEDMSVAVAEHEYAPAVAYMDPRLCVKEILDPKNSATELRSGPAYGVFALKRIGKGEILGEYGGEVKEYDYMYALCMSLPPEQRLLMDYHHELHSSNSWIKGGLVVDGQEYRSLVAFCNDYRSFNTRPHRRQNAMFREVVIDGWPHVFLTAIESIEAGDEVLVDYGEHFWEAQEEIRKIRDQIEQECARRSLEERAAFSSRVSAVLQRAGTEKHVQQAVEEIFSTPAGAAGVTVTARAPSAPVSLSSASAREVIIKPIRIEMQAPLSSLRPEDARTLPAFCPACGQPVPLVCVAEHVFNCGRAPAVL